MSTARIEAVASLHLLVWIAKADQSLHKAERVAIDEALREVQLDDLVSTRELFDEDFDVAEQVALLRSKVAREEAFRAAYSLAFIDGDCSAAERARLGELRKLLEIDGARDQELAEAAHKGSPRSAREAAPGSDAPGRWRRAVSELLATILGRGER